ncbi:ATP-citrate synthase subunit 1 [Kwoniella mangroviensis CBS 10435]|uniref:ATP citrate synthase n=1 Tax=Kwoniella mangroviensis CBS 10435 TaxID=1331196 RepID=A0A1B9ITD7_9TREE|nr:ATP-citrate synthase subunit 1 [Kwoniella mangroviensis CBS 8507]OCF58799.1 ATP-citrate synthase subunit 1 [Kwoniella mangroviensis CBS 10435]OCF68589.1 ATP-citrate synthase subunit 1 [Kwoniella mangroviensis CBS 8507]
MSTKAIREFDAKQLVSYWLNRSPTPIPTKSESSLSAAQVAQVEWDPVTKQLSPPIKPGQGLPDWVFTSKLVGKPDQLIKRRGKAGLLCLNKGWEETGAWIEQRAGKPVTVESTTGTLNTFIIEPFCPHPAETEYYVCINSTREGDWILFTHEGGVDVGDVDAKALKLLLPVGEEFPTRENLISTLLANVAPAKQDVLADFLIRLYAVYVDLHFAYLEINPLVVLDAAEGKPSEIHYLDMAAKLDQTADFLCGPKWAVARDTVTPSAGSSAIKADRGPPMVWPAPFGRDLTKEEAYIQKLDASTGASLKLTVLNQAGRVWTMVAGGGASVVYSDAIAAAGFAHELANYGEYSGAPTEGQTYEYAKTIIDLIVRGEPHPEGKVLIIGGGAANFSDVAATFKGIIRALKQFKEGLLRHKVSIWVRRAGPNYQEGLKAMRLCGESIGVPMKVYGPESPITAIVPMALGIQRPASAATRDVTPIASSPASPSANSPAPLPGSGEPSTVGSVKPDGSREQPNDHIVRFETEKLGSRPWFRPFDEHTRSFVFGLQPRAIQGMLDFDFSCGRKTPSVAAMIYPFGGHHIQKFYWGTKETLLPVYTSVGEAIKKHPDVDVVVNFSSSRSVYASTLDILTYPQIKAIGIIAEGVPERHARELLHLAVKKEVIIIGPATVGGIKPGCFRIGNTGGMMDNLIACKLYRPGSVGYVSKSGGMSNELNNILSYTTNGVYEGVAIGGDRYPGTSFIDHLLRYEADPECKLLLLLGEVGGTEEYRVIEAVKKGIIKKPIVAWAIGTCAKMFTSEVQFGHAGSMANSDLETADAKNRAMKAAGFIVPDTFEDLPEVLKATYQKLVSAGAIVPKAEIEPPQIPMDYQWASKLGLIRKPAAFISTISDERGQELMYAGMRISDVFKEELGIGGVISLLWFKRRLPAFACKFIEMVLQLTADHGPAVSGAMNTIITARAGKDLISSLVAGLLTIGDRFGGALDGAAAEFSRGVSSGLTPREFVDQNRKANKLIPGIGHKIKSKTNPDLRVTLVVDYVKKHFPSHKTLDFALAVEDVTTQKANTLILNVDGAIAASFCDLLSGSGAFTEEEAAEYLKSGTLNGLFVLGRSIGFIGHYLDQRLLKQPLYRHPADDIFINMQERVVFQPGSA